MIYTKDNPKLVKNCFIFEGKDTFTGVVKDKKGNIAYFLNGKFHRKDEPAIEFADGSKFWILNNEYHREGRPAIEWTSGSKEWLLNGKHSRGDGPSFEYVDGGKSWYLNGMCYGRGNDFTNESWTRFVKLELLK